jgi:phospholipid/cholesterol/gamma-HCH transport system substrate-binding protein
MMWYTRAERPRYLLLGVLFLVLMVGFVALSVAIYRKVFTPVELVTLRIERTGTQLSPGADVKVRGVWVGSVRAVSADAAGAAITLALDPRSAALVPANVSARVLPKTLFGERYVDLVPPPTPARPIAAGDVIGQDRSQAAIEAEQVLDHLLPTLTAVRPSQVAVTLSALSQALRGRGAQLGGTLVALDDYLRRFNPVVPDLVTVFDDLPPVTDTYARVAPDFFAALADLTTTSQTLVDKRDDVHRTFVEVADAADQLTRYLADNRHDLVALVGVDTPRYQDNRGPHCYDQTPVFPQYPPGGPLRDGSRKPAAPNSDQPDPLVGLLLVGGGDGRYADDRTNDTIAGHGRPDEGQALLMVPFIGGRHGGSGNQPHPPTPLEGP